MVREGLGWTSEEQPLVSWVPVNLGDALPAAWAEIEDGLVDTREEGVSNQGHTFMLGEYNGLPALTPEARSDLIMFLKTL